MPEQIRYVGVIVPTGARGLVEGVAQFAYPSRPWRVKWFSGWGGTNLVEDVFSAKFDGIIVCEDRRGLAAAVAKGPWPVVLATDAFDNASLPRADTDDDAVARLAADYLLDRGFEHLLVCGTKDIASYATRCGVFRDRVTAAGKTCVWWQRSEYESDRAQELATRVLRAQPKPLGVFCESSWVAKQIADVCHRCGLRVPEDVAILGVGNDELICKLTYPPLSSVVTPDEEIGYRAAELLDALMNKRPVKQRRLALGPLGIMSRASTDVLAIADAELADALRFIRENAHKPIDVTSILSAVPIGRRTLEKKFRTLLKRSPLDEIRRIRLENAKLHLATSDLPIAEIAKRCGLPDARRFATVFKQHYHCTPKHFREQARHPKAESRTNAPLKAQKA